jgi:hypothetical protein
MALCIIALKHLLKTMKNSKSLNVKPAKLPAIMSDRNVSSNTFLNVFGPEKDCSPQYLLFML